MYLIAGQSGGDAQDCDAKSAGRCEDRVKSAGEGAWRHTSH